MRVALALLCTLAATASASTKREKERAARMLGVAVEFQEAGKHAEALDLLTQVHRVFQHSKTLYYRAISLQALGRFQEAKSVLETIVDHPSLSKHRDTMVEMLKQIGDMLLPVVVRVDTTPQGAWVAVDGARKGQSPLSIPLPPRKYQVQVESPGFLRIDQAVDVKAGQGELQLQLTLQAAPVSVQISTVPDAARASVHIDGHSAGETPLVTELAPATYQLSLRAEGYEPVSQTLTVVIGESVDLKIPLLAVRAEPAGVVVAASPPSTLVPWTMVIGGSLATLAGTAFVGVHYELKGRMRTGEDNRADDTLDATNLYAGLGLLGVGLGSVLVGWLSFPDEGAIALLPEQGGWHVALRAPW
jgi:hypothetical protein